MPIGIKAEVAEAIFKANHGKLESLGGEFFWSKLDKAESRLVKVPGVARFSRS
jgi:hypothetical protein